MSSIYKKGERIMEIHKKDLTKEAFCTTRQKFAFGEVDSRSAGSKPLTMYQIVVDTIKGVISGDFEPDEIRDLIDGAGEFSDLPEEDKALKDACELRVRNYFGLMGTRQNPHVIEEAKTIKLPYCDDEISVKPDVWYDDGVTIEVVYIKTGSRYVMGEEFLPSMYNGILYGRTLVPEGQSRSILCTYAEVKLGKTQSLKEEFWPLPDGIGSDLDDRAKQEFEELSQGTECEGTDCRYCPGRFECHYVAPALALEPESEEGTTRKSKKVLLSDAQKAVVAFGA